MTGTGGNLETFVHVTSAETPSREIPKAKPFRTKRRKKETCSKCAASHDRFGQAYCLDCHNAFMRQWRKDHRLAGTALEKSSTRAYANQYKKRGKIVPQPCIVCDDPNSEMHHPDYNRPLWVQWLCRPCHLSLHRLVEKEYDAEKLKDSVREQRELIAFLKQEAA